MGRPGVTYLDIAKAATQLVEQGQYPSIEAVRQILGTGSNGTINRYLKAWRDKQGNRLEAEQGLPETLLVAVKGLYDGIKEQADVRVVTVEQETKQKLNELEQRLLVSTDANKQLLNEKNALEAQIATSQANEKALQLEFAQLHQTVEKQSAENHLLQLRLSDKTEEMQRLSQQVLQAQANFEHYSEAVRIQREEERQRFEERIKTLEFKLQQERELITNLQQTTAVQAKELVFMEEEKNRNNNLLQESQQKILQLQSDQQALKNNSEQLQEKYGAVLEEQQKTGEELKATLSHYQQLQMTLAEYTERLRMIQTALQKAEDEITLLRDKNLFLTHENVQLSLKKENIRALSSFER